MAKIINAPYLFACNSNLQNVTHQLFLVVPVEPNFTVTRVGSPTTEADDEDTTKKVKIYNYSIIEGALPNPVIPNHYQEYIQLNLGSEYSKIKITINSSKFNIVNLADIANNDTSVTPEDGYAYERPYGFLYYDKNFNPHRYYPNVLIPFKNNSKSSNDIVKTQQSSLYFDAEIEMKGAKPTGIDIDYPENSNSNWYNGVVDANQYAMNFNVITASQNFRIKIRNKTANSMPNIVDDFHAIVVDIKRLLLKLEGLYNNK